MNRHSQVEPMDVGGAIQAIISERRAQIRKFGATRGLSDHEFLAILGEEFGEVSHEVNEGTMDTLDARQEIIQCAAVCLAWLTGDVNLPIDSIRLGHLR